MIYEYRCGCGNKWEEVRKLSDYSQPAFCECGEVGKRVLSALPSSSRRTHPDVKQDIHELVAGVPASNYTEI
jgi:putative FmdB family regulatory protein